MEDLQEKLEKTKHVLNAYEQVYEEIKKVTPQRTNATNSADVANPFQELSKAFERFQVSLNQQLSALDLETKKLDKQMIVLDKLQKKKKRKSGRNGGARRHNGATQ